MDESACIKRMAALRNYSTNTIMEKNKQRGMGGGGGGLRISNFQE